MKFKKTITFIILSTYLFLSGCFNSPAFCMGLCNEQHHEKRMIKCACCMHKKSPCNCFKTNQPLNHIDIQSLIKPIQDSVYFENSCKISAIFDLIMFKESSYNKIHPDQIIIPNKNLAMLRTVILLI